MLQKAKQEHERHRSLQRAIGLVDQARSKLPADEVGDELEEERKESTRRVLEDTRRELATQLEQLESPQHTADTIGETETPVDEPEQTQGPPYWLIVRHDGSQMEFLTVNSAGNLHDGGKVLPIFGSGEEAGLFLKVRAPGSGWRLRQTGAGELVSVLLGPRNDVGHVAIDPAPEESHDGAADLVGREGFMDLLMGRGRAWFHRFHHNHTFHHGARHGVRHGHNQKPTEGAG